ncbi:1950_t:CDS:2, partial [Gigaspora rosea]
MNPFFEMHTSLFPISLNNEMSSTFHSDVIDDLKELYKTKEDYDTIIIVGEENKEEFQAHSLILRARSIYFRTALSSKWIKNNKNAEDLKDKECVTLLKLQIAAEQLDIQRLINFTQTYFRKLKNKLHELIQLVRFHQINGEEFMLKVWPYKHILPDNLVGDILRCYLVSNPEPHYHLFPIRVGNINSKIDSIIINKRIAQLLFTKLINKKTVNNEDSKKIKYNFILLFRSSRDGRTSQKFHQKCDNRGATIFIAKISNSITPLIGGYNPLDWNGNGQYKITTDSFLFSLSDLNNPQTAKLGHVTNSNYAVYCHNDYGPTFGGGPATGFTFGGGPTVGGSATFGGFGGGATLRNPQTSGGTGGSHDLYVPSNGAVWQCNVHSYPNIGIPISFAVSDYEVFQ